MRASSKRTAEGHTNILDTFHPESIFSAFYRNRVPVIRWSLPKCSRVAEGRVALRNCNCRRSPRETHADKSRRTRHRSPLIWPYRNYVHFSATASPRTLFLFKGVSSLLKFSRAHTFVRIITAEINGFRASGFSGASVVRPFLFASGEARRFREFLFWAVCRSSFGGHCAGISQVQKREMSVRMHAHKECLNQRAGD